MKIIQQTIASLGSPLWIEPLDRPYGSTAVIARWRHINGRLRIATADAIRVCLSLSTGQHVRHAERDRALTKSVLAGDVIVLRPGIPSETMLDGDAEIVQIFIDPASLGQAANNALNGSWAFIIGLMLLTLAWVLVNSAGVLGQAPVGVSAPLRSRRL